MPSCVCMCVCVCKCVYLCVCMCAIADTDIFQKQYIPKIQMEILDGLNI